MDYPLCYLECTVNTIFGSRILIRIHSMDEVREIKGVFWL